jgi:ElaB/YqjD/DUF883 family membrane-anchored ribosome-binding protein
MKSKDLTEKSQRWQEEAQEAGQEFQSKFQEKASDLQDAAQEWMQRANEACRKAARATDDYVHENPWGVIGSVALAGLLLGVILGRSRD